MENPSRRSIYVLSIWQERPETTDVPAVWRINVEDVRTGEKRAFANPQDVLVFLKKQMVDRPLSSTAQFEVATEKVPTSHHEGTKNTENREIST